ncbi:MAG: ATP-binding protein, partial [Candidatus Nanopelagicales bacterium]
MSYDASAITVLEGLDAVRKRPGMYIGSTGERGLHHLVYEVVDNSVDEAMAGYATTISVTLLANGGVRVVDDGRGIPVDIVESEGKPAVEVVLTVLHAGGKFGGGGYSVSGGLHGVGVSVVNALSKHLDVEVGRNGHVYRQSYLSGVPQAPLEMCEEADSTGTTITFWADEDIFETTTFDFTTLARRFQEMAFLNKGLTLELTDERTGVHKSVSQTEAESSAALEGTEIDDAEPVRSVRYHYDGGIADFVEHINASKGASHQHIIYFETEADDKAMSAEIALQWNSTYAESVYTFANTINTTEGGTHEEGFRTALTTLMNKFAREWNILKEKDTNLSGEDIREGLTAIISVKLTEPQFEGQTKTKLGITEMKAFVQKAVNDQLGG